MTATMAHGHYFLWGTFFSACTSRFLIKGCCVSCLAMICFLILRFFTASYDLISTVSRSTDLFSFFPCLTLLE